MHRRTLLAIVAALAAAGATYAAENPGKVYKALASQSRADAQAKVKAMFERMDSNHDGAVTRDELDAYRAARRAARQANAPERRERVFAAMDSDKNGQISKGEFDKFAESRKQHTGHLTRAGLAGGDWFSRVDANHDEKVTLDEAQKSAMALFDAADADHNGIVTPEERRQARAKQ
jgi:hypothetical protein